MLDFKSWQFIRESGIQPIEECCMMVVHDSMIGTYHERLIEAITLTNSKVLKTNVLIWKFENLKMYMRYTESHFQISKFSN